MSDKIRQYFISTLIQFHDRFQDTGPEFHKVKMAGLGFHDFMAKSVNQHKKSSKIP